MASKFYLSAHDVLGHIISACPVPRLSLAVPARLIGYLFELHYSAAADTCDVTRLRQTIIGRTYRWRCTDNRYLKFMLSAPIIIGGIGIGRALDSMLAKVYCGFLQQDVNFHSNAVV